MACVTLREILRTEYQLRFSCGTNSRGNCTAVLQRTNNVSYEIIKCYNANV